MYNWKKAGKKQELSWVWHSEETKGKSPLVLCLAENEAAAERCLSQLEKEAGQAILAAVVLPDESMGGEPGRLGFLLERP